MIEVGNDARCAVSRSRYGVFYYQSTEESGWGGGGFCVCQAGTRCGRKKREKGNKAEMATHTHKAHIKQRPRTV
jgi:hypothetical protein